MNASARSDNSRNNKNTFPKCKRRDSSPIEQFILDKNRKSFNAVKRATSQTLSEGSEVNQSNNKLNGYSSNINFFGSAGVCLLPQAWLSEKTISSSLDVSSLGLKNVAIFKNVSYLGCSKIDDPVSETEMLQIIENFNAEKLHNSVSVCLHIPSNSSGTVHLFENSLPIDYATVTETKISSFPVHRIRFCARGKPFSNESNCFALSFTQHFNLALSQQVSENSKTSLPSFHQCHVFRCQDSEIAGNILMYFANAFRNNDGFNGQLNDCNQEIVLSETEISANYHSMPGVEENFEFEAFLEIKEEDFNKKGFFVCPVEKNCIKMRRDCEKRVIIVLRQTFGPRQLRIKKCFGLLLAAGRNLRQSDMHLLDIVSASEVQSKVFVVEAVWNPSAQNFEVLNTETPKETRVFMTIAIDVILNGIDEPVRFNMECKARIFQQFERFWLVPRNAINEKYFLTIKMDDSTNQASTSNVYNDLTLELPVHLKSSNFSKYTMVDSFKMIFFESLTERQRNLSKKTFGDRSPTEMPIQLIHPADEDESDSDEPLLSGSGFVNRECSNDILSIWRKVICKWKEEPDERPDELNAIILTEGIPDVLRGEVWQLLAKVHTSSNDLIQTYRMLLDKECPSEQVILRDIHRTFPAHDYFKEPNGVGQEALFKISKAYSLYDEEVSYCQGLSYLAAALLLHMPEEQAFCVLIKIMFNYGLRDLFKLGFDTLHLRFYQLQRLIEDYEHELFTHFHNVGVETHMYASQWFLTLFTAKFSLQMVFFIVDLFLTEGVNTIFHISLALLQDSKKDLLQLDFEGILKYFRVTLPRHYRTEINAKELIRSAVKLKISHKRLGKYEKEYILLKQQEVESLDPLERLERENSRLKETMLRLERENDDLAHELVTSKIELRNKLDITEDQLETTVAVVERTSRAYKKLSEESENLREETDMIKGMCRQEVSRLNDEILRAQKVIEQYKKICTDLGNTFEEDRCFFEEQKRIVVARISGCERCVEAIKDWHVDSPRNCIHHNSSHNNNNLDKLNLTNQCNLKLATTDDLSPVRQRKDDYTDVSTLSTDRHITTIMNGDFPKGASSSAFYIVDLMNRLEERENHIRQVELELAQTKLALVESQCQNQELTHQMKSLNRHILVKEKICRQKLKNEFIEMTTNMHTAASDQDSRPAWIRKTISSIREVGVSLKSQPTVSSATLSGVNASFSVVANRAAVVNIVPATLQQKTGSNSVNGSNSSISECK